MSGNGYCDACNWRRYLERDPLATVVEFTNSRSYSPVYEIVNGEGRTTGTFLHGSLERCQGIACKSMEPPKRHTPDEDK